MAVKNSFCNFPPGFRFPVSPVLAKWNTKNFLHASNSSETKPRCAIFSSSFFQASSTQPVYLFYLIRSQLICAHTLHIGNGFGRNINIYLNQNPIFLKQPNVWILCNWRTHHHKNRHKPKHDVTDMTNPIYELSTVLHRGDPQWCLLYQLNFFDRRASGKIPTVGYKIFQNGLFSTPDHFFSCSVLFSFVFVL